MDVDALAAVVYEWEEVAIGWKLVLAERGVGGLCVPGRISSEEERP